MMIKADSLPVLTDDGDDEDGKKERKEGKEGKRGKEEVVVITYRACITRLE